MREITLRELVAKLQELCHEGFSLLPVHFGAKTKVKKITVTKESINIEVEE